MTTDSGSKAMIAFRCPVETREELKEWCFEHDRSVAEVMFEVVTILINDGDWLGEEVRERLIGSGVRFEEVGGG